MGIIEGKTFQADIYVGFYDTQRQRMVGSISKTREVCQKYCDDISYCVSIVPVHFVYSKGNEEGAKITLINYLRFPVQDTQIIIHAKNLAKKLMVTFNQMRVSIVTSTGTIMLSSENTD